jgi:hypothetical protein
MGVGNWLMEEAFIQTRRLIEHSFQNKSQQFVT